MKQIAVKEESMVTYIISYKPFGIGNWTKATVSKDIAETLYKEYTEYGWPVSIEQVEVATDSKDESTTTA
ncbi:MULTISPECIES: hypothetical protein [Vibrio]|uniref:Uncharacterized protein n=2 Tax=Vibrio TaxID=662 RepID=A0ABV4M3D4_9VIBR